ncbi:NADPH-dependent FMN reductase [Xylaria arbuscula]|nr:NADPH-dependent FMN reductase [Xylaria arbuscula]
MSAKSVALITLSVRAARAGGNIASFVQPFFQKALAPANVKLSPVDLKDFNLPIFTENVAPAMIPAMGQFQQETSEAWSAEIAKYDGYIIVIPEYNGGVSGGAKNAIDYLFNEWKGKPLTIVSYGSRGGSRASDQAKDILSGVGLKVTETRPQLAFANPMAEVKDLMAEGKLSDESKAKWLEQSGEITKAAEELKELLLQTIDEAIAPPS